LPQKDNRNPSHPIEQQLEDLQHILTEPREQEIENLRRDVDSIQELIEDDELLIERLEAIFPRQLERLIVREPDIAVNILKPIIFPLITRAAQDAVRRFTGRIDLQLQSAFSLSNLRRRVSASLQGISYSELIMREGLDFEVHEIFLIHYETGLLLQHISSTYRDTHNSEMISGMLTAIRDFAQSALTKDNKSGITLDGIETSSQEIMIEADKHVYMAVVVNGFAPANFRGRIRKILAAVDQEYRDALVSYNGDASQFEQVKTPLLELMSEM